MACLPDLSKLVYPNTSEIQAFIAGWGVTNLIGEFAIYANKLQNTNVTIYEMSSCLNVQTSFTKMADAQICAGDISGVKDSCYGKLFFFNNKKGGFQIISLSKNTFKIFNYFFLNY